MQKADTLEGKNGVSDYGSLGENISAMDIYYSSFSVGKMDNIPVLNMKMRIMGCIWVGISGNVTNGSPCN